MEAFWMVLSIYQEKMGEDFSYAREIWSIYTIPQKTYICIYTYTYPDILMCNLCSRLQNTKDMMLTAAVDEFDTLDADEDRGPGVIFPRPPSWKRVSEVSVMVGKGNKYLHPRNLTWNLKNDGWKMSFLLGFPISRGYVKFQGSRWW